MSEANADWISDSNTACNVSLVTPGVGGPKALYSFNPKMTYAIFGEEEQIFGYQGLKINLRYNHCDMRPGLQITYSKKFKAIGDTEPTDLKSIFEDYLPKTAFEKSSVYDAAISDSSYANWKPPGELWQSMEADGINYEIWKGSLADLAVQQLVKRVQILVPFFIEGGTLIDLGDPDSSLERWTVFFLYQKKTGDLAPALSPYTFVGYSTVYRYFYYQAVTPPSSPATKKQPIHKDATDFDLSFPELSFSSFPCRSRISQFVILPPFHKGGNGSRLYNSVFDYYHQEAQTIEITVEDPNEAFDDLRDINDLARLRKLPEFTEISINTKVIPRSKGPVPRDIVDLKALEKIRTKTKIAPRQFHRVVEMQLLSKIPPGVKQTLIHQKPTISGAELKAKQREYHLWQLLCKQRLYRHNKDMLIQLDRSERIEKLEQALGSVEVDYDRLLEALKKRDGKSVSSGASNGKRSSSGDEDMEDGEPAAKKAKFT